MKSIMRHALVSVLLVLGASNASAGFVEGVATFEGIFDVRSTGTADVNFTGFDLFTAIGETTGGVTDAISDGEFIDLQETDLGVGLATNGPLFSQSFASTASGESFNEARANTFLEAEMELIGTGTLEIDLGYSLTSDGFGNAPSAFSDLFISASASSAIESVSASLSGSDLTGAGSFDSVFGVLTLVFELDDFGTGFPIFDNLIVSTGASVRAVSEPATALLLLGGLAALLVRRRA